MLVAGRDLRQVASVLAISALAVYVSGELLFRLASVLTTYPVLASFSPLNIFECASMALAIAAISIRRHRWTVWQTLLAAGALAALLYSSYRTGDYRLVHGYILIIALAGTDLSRLCAAYGATMICVLVLVIALSVFGLLYNRDAIPNSRLVFAYGFGHPNGVAAYLFAAIGAIAYVCWERRTWWVPLVLSLCAAAFSYAFLSSHGGAAALALLTLAILLGHVRKLRRVADIPRTVFFLVLTIVPLVILIIMLVGTAFYDAESPLFAGLNKLIHGRLQFAHQYYEANGGFTFLGRKYAPGASSYHSGLPFSSVDSGYSYAAMVFGWASVCAIYGTYATAVWNLSRERGRFFIFVLFLICAAYLVIEGYQLYIATSAGVLFLSAAFADKGDVTRADSRRGSPGGCERGRIHANQ